MWGVRVGVRDPFEGRQTEQDVRGQLILDVQPT